MGFCRVHAPTDRGAGHRAGGLRPKAASARRGGIHAGRGLHRVAQDPPSGPAALPDRAGLHARPEDEESPLRTKAWGQDPPRAGKAATLESEYCATILYKARLHPQNRFVGDKIRPATQSPPAPSPVRRAGLRAAGRQQLQRLRDMGFVEFVGRGEYRVSSKR